jgi:hypothetical protein
VPKRDEGLIHYSFLKATCKGGLAAILFASIKWRRYKNFEIASPALGGIAVTKDEDLTNLIKRRYFVNDERDC